METDLAKRKIVVDAMGGDGAPEVIVHGAVLFARVHDVGVILVGLSDKINEELQKYDDYKTLAIEVKHASEVVEMHESAGKVLRSKKDSSMRVGLELVKNGEAGAFVSAGNTGAILAYSTFVLRLLKGVDRPAIAVQLPTLKGTSILLDAGANVDCKTLQLFQFGIMGHVYAKYILEKENPRVGLLSIGEEDGKGNEVTREVFKLLKTSDINFLGNLEAKEVFKGTADVIVCDGFTGNIALKISESLADMIGKNLKNLFNSGISTKLGYFLLKSRFDKFKKSVDYSETGGAPLLGVKGVCIIGHGSSSPKAIMNAIHRANEFVDKKINEHIRDDIESNLNDSGQFRKGSLWKQIREIAFGSEGQENNPQAAPETTIEKDSDPKESSETKI